jgi:carboxyl-terminal processing protease
MAMRNGAAVMLCTLLTGLMALTAQGQSWPRTLSSDDRIYGLAMVWQDVNTMGITAEQPGQPDPDSLFRAFIPLVIRSANDYEYYRLLQRFAASFNDAGTFVSLPKALSDSVSSPPLIIKEIRGRFFVVNSDKALTQKIPIGSEVLRVNGFEIRSFLEEEVLPYVSAGTPQAKMLSALDVVLDGWVNTQVLLNYVTPDNRNLNEMFVRSRPRRVQWERPIADSRPVLLSWPKPDIALITINSFDRDILKNFPHSRQFSKANRVILDLRNSGQPVHTGVPAVLAMRFLDSTTLVLPGFGMRNIPFSFPELDEGLTEFYGMIMKTTRYEYTEGDTLPVEHFGDTIRQPVTVLIGPGTANGAEAFLKFLQREPGRVVLIGEPTAGSAAHSISQKLPGGGIIHTNIRYEAFSDDDIIIPMPLLPDIPVSPDIKSILNGEDLPLKEAMRN